MEIKEGFYWLKPSELETLEEQGKLEDKYERIGFRRITFLRNPFKKIEDEIKYYARQKNYDIIVKTQEFGWRIRWQKIAFMEFEFYRLRRKKEFHPGRIIHLRNQTMP